MKATTWISVFVVIMLAASVVTEAECIALWHTARDAQRGSTLVFSGTVTKVGDVTTSFEVDRVWKGRVQRHTTLVLMPGMEVLGSSYFKEGRGYLIFADLTIVTTPRELTEVPEGTPIFAISVCSATRPLTEAQEFVKQLGPSRPPRP